MALLVHLPRFSSKDVLPVEHSRAASPLFVAGLSCHGTASHEPSRPRTATLYLWIANIPWCILPYTSLLLEKRGREAITNDSNCKNPIRQKQRGCTLETFSFHILSGLFVSRLFSICCILSVHKNQQLSYTIPSL